MVCHQTPAEIDFKQCNLEKHVIHIHASSLEAFVLKTSTVTVIVSTKREVKIYYNF